MVKGREVVNLLKLNRFICRCKQQQLQLISITVELRNALASRTKLMFSLLAFHTELLLFSPLFFWIANYFNLFQRFGNCFIFDDVLYHSKWNFSAEHISYKTTYTVSKCLFENRNGWTLSMTWIRSSEYSWISLILPIEKNPIITDKRRGRTLSGCWFTLKIKTLIMFVILILNCCSCKSYGRRW